MHKTFKLISLLLLLSLVIVQGCGSGDGELVGSLDMTATKVDDGSGFFHIESTATYKHPSKDVTGTEINYSELIYTSSGILRSSSMSKKVNSSGGVTFISAEIQQTGEPIFVDITTSTGALTQFKRITIVATTPLNVTPSAVGYAVTDPVGTAKTSTISGGLSPYTASSSTPDITASVNNTTLSITNNVPITAARTATITVTDSSGATKAVTVTY